MFSWFARTRASRPNQVETALPPCQDGQDEGSGLAFLATLDDEELAIRLASGTDDALTILFERHCALVFRIARRRLRDTGEAEETVQQVFFDVYKAIKSFDPAKGSFKVWLFQFAYHRTINRRDYLNVRHFYEWREFIEAPPAELFVGAGRALQLSSQELAHLVEQLLSTLKTRQRKVMELTFWEGLTAEEVAARIGESPTVVRHSLYRGLAKLRDELWKAQNSRAEPAKDELRAEGIILVEPRTL
jgi:RNA polymerase sigma-70 factor (ECF subfamily)